MKTTVYNKDGEKVKELELDPAIFEVEANPGLVHQVFVSMMANRRGVVAHAKDRSEVRGGGRKPWRQKGTGRARHGSIRSPLWVGGGATFGPTRERAFAKKINKKARRKALLMVLSDKARNSKLVVVDKMDMPEIKTKLLVQSLEKLPLGKGKTLIVVPESNALVSKSAGNIANVSVSRASDLNLVDTLQHDFLLVEEAGIAKIAETFGKK